MSDQMSPALASRQRRRIIDDASQGLGISRGAHLSIKGGRFTLVDAKGDLHPVTDANGHPQFYLDVVIMDANDRASRIYYEGEFDPTMTIPPTCFSDNGTGPSTMAMQPQAPNCQVCPHNVRGSDTTFRGKPTTACSNRKKLAFIVPGDPQVNVYELQIPPGSLTNLRDYTKWLGQQASGIQGRQLDIADVVTRLAFDPDPNRLFTLTFKATSYADDEYTLKAIDYIDANKLSDQAVGRNDVACDPEQVKMMLAAAPQRQQIENRQDNFQAAPAQNFGSLPPRGQQGFIAGPAAQAAEQHMVFPESRTAEAMLPHRAANQPGPAQEATSPKPRTPRKPPAAPTQNRGTPPFMAPAAQTSQPAVAGQALTSVQAPASDMDIPPFLRRTSEAPAPAAQQPRFGVGQPPAPPAEIQDAIQQAMNLPTRRG